ncbi:DNA-binding transcriptional activator OsmE, partial [Pseudomonas savastanoi pv. glycinea]
MDLAVSGTCWRIFKGPPRGQGLSREVLPYRHLFFELLARFPAQSATGPRPALTCGAITMYKKIFAATFVLATMAGCSNTTVQNPVDYVTYRNEPLVKQVENGMTRQQVLTIGGEPSST